MDATSEVTPSRPLQRLRVFLLTVALPFFYGAATRVPLIYIGVEARFKYMLPWWEVGLVIASYQLSRAAVNSIIPVIGNITGHVIGVCLGIIGYLLHAIIKNNLPLFWVSIAMVGFSEVIICMQSYVKVEVSDYGNLRLREYLRMQYACNVAGTAIGFTLAAALYNTNGVSAAAYFGCGLEVAELLSLFGYLSLCRWWPSSEINEAFVVSSPVLGVTLPPDEAGTVEKEEGGSAPAQAQPEGTLISPFDVENTTTFSKGTVSKHVSKLSSFNKPVFDKHTVSLPENELSAAETMAFLEGMNIEPSIKMAFRSRNAIVPLQSLCSYEVEHRLEPHFTQKSDRFATRLMSIVESGDFKNAAETATTAAASAPSENNRPPWIVYLIVVTFAVQALMIGVILSTAPILFYDIYKLKFVFVGLILGIGEFLGCATLFLLVPTVHQQKIRKYFRGPMNLLVVVGILGLLALLYGIKHLAAAIVATLLIMALNDFGTSLAAEFQGGVVHSDFYTQVNALANTCRRIGNTVTAVLGPILFGVSYWCPFVVFGVLTLVWMVIMAVAFHIRANQVIATHYTNTNTSSPPSFSPLVPLVPASGEEIMGPASSSQGDISVVPVEESKKRVPRGLKFYMTEQSYITSELLMWDKK
jgi:MFS family permease